MCDICVFKLCHPSFFKKNPQILDIISKIEDDILFRFILCLLGHIALSCLLLSLF